ncbi:MAG TPA: FliH/SctL family protein [Vampirovibrionales bacterium]
MLIKKKLYDSLFEEHGVLEEDSSEIDTEDAINRAIDGAGNNSGVDKDSLLAEVKQQADEIIAQAKKEAEKIKENSQQEIRKKIKEAIGNQLNKFNELQAKALKELEDVSKVKAQIINESEQIVTELATQIASKILTKKVKEDKSFFTKLFQETVSELSAGVEDVVKINFVINPQDLSIAKQLIKELQEKAAGKLDLSLKENEDIQEGSLIAETPSGSLDLNFSTQLEVFKQKMLHAEENQTS